MMSNSLLQLIPETVAADSVLNRKRRRDDRGHEAALGNGNSPASSTDYSSTKTKTVHISTIILAAKSPFFYKLFSNGMTESNQEEVTLQIQESEEAALMELLKFMYTNKLSSTTPSALVDVLIAADKYEVACCMKHCFQLLHKLPMTSELALLCLGLPSTILIADTDQSTTVSAKEFLIERYRDINKFQEEMLSLPLVVIEAVLSSDDLQVTSEDEIYDFVMNWARRHYTKRCERQEILIMHLLHFIRFSFMSRSKLKEFLTCTDINLEHKSEVVLDAISREAPDRQLPRILQEQGRDYTYPPLRVTRFSLPHEEYVVYLDLKREECARGPFCSLFIDCGRRLFNLMGFCTIDQQRSSKKFILCLMVQKNDLVGFTVYYDVSTRMKPEGAFVIHKKKNRILTGEKRPYALFGMPWDTLLAEDNPNFINGVLHLRVELRLKKIVA